MVIRFHFRDAGPRERRWWLVVENAEADLCRDDPGDEPTLIVESTLRALTEIWTGDSNPEIELSARHVRVAGAERDVRDLWRWLGRSMFAPSKVAR